MATRDYSGMYDIEERKKRSPRTAGESNPAYLQRLYPSQAPQYGNIWNALHAAYAGTPAESVMDPMFRAGQAAVQLGPNVARGVVNWASGEEVMRPPASAPLPIMGVGAASPRQPLPLTYGGPAGQGPGFAGSTMPDYNRLISQNMAADVSDAARAPIADAWKNQNIPGIFTSPGGATIIRNAPGQYEAQQQRTKEDIARYNQDMAGSQQITQSRAQAAYERRMGEWQNANPSKVPTRVTEDGKVLASRKRTREEIEDAREARREQRADARMAMEAEATARRAETTAQREAAKQMTAEQKTAQADAEKQQKAKVQAVTDADKFFDDAIGNLAIGDEEVHPKARAGWAEWWQANLTSPNPMPPKELWSQWTARFPQALKAEAKPKKE